MSGPAEQLRVGAFLFTVNGQLFGEAGGRFLGINLTGGTPTDQKNGFVSFSLGAAAVGAAGAVQMSDGAGGFVSTAAGDSTWNVTNGQARIDVDAASFIRFSFDGATRARFRTGALEMSVPTIGLSAPFSGLNGEIAVLLGAAENRVLAANEFKMTQLIFTSNGANIVQFPAVLIADDAYPKYVRNDGGGGTISVRDTAGNAAALLLASGTGAFFGFRVGVVQQLTAAL